MIFLYSLNKNNFSLLNLIILLMLELWSILSWNKTKSNNHSRYFLYWWFWNKRSYRQISRHASRNRCNTRKTTNTKIPTRTSKWWWFSIIWGERSKKQLNHWSNRLTHIIRRPRLKKINIPMPSMWIRKRIHRQKLTKRKRRNLPKM